MSKSANLQQSATEGTEVVEVTAVAGLCVFPRVDSKTNTFYEHSRTFNSNEVSQSRSNRQSGEVVIGPNVAQTGHAGVRAHARPLLGFRKHDPAPANSASWRAFVETTQYEADGPLTLSAAIRLAFGPSGKYVVDGEWEREVRRRLAQLVVFLEDPVIVELSHGHYRAVWRWLATQHRDQGTSGPRAAEMYITDLAGIVNWLSAEERIPPHVGQPAPGWKNRMRQEWTSITGKPIAPPRKLRYTKPEQELLWTALPRAYPPLELAFQVGAERRLGQVVRAMRSHITPLTTEEYGAQELGVLTIHGRGKKRGGVIVLTDEDREVIREAMQRGYLKDLEAAYQAGILKDYHLCPGGSFARNRAQVKNAFRCISNRTVRKYWLELEELAGVEHVEGRGWYGQRRAASDHAEDIESDERVNNQIGGWTSSEMRRGYQDSGRIDIPVRASLVRRQIRPRVQRSARVVLT